MKLLKNPIFWVFVLVLALVLIGYKVMERTALEQEAIRYKEGERTLVLYQYNLYGLAVVPPSTLWAAGSGGVILHSVDSGDTWDEKQVGSPEQVFSSICFPDREHGWVVGTRGMILHTEDEGKTWKRVERNDGIYFSRVFFLDADHGWIVGEMGTILLTTDGGKTWDLIETDKFMTIFNDIKFADENMGWVVGEQGVIMFSSDGGRTWKDQKSKTDKSLMSIFVGCKNYAWIGGLGGTILHTRDAGNTWEKKMLMHGEDEIKNHVYKIYENERGIPGKGPTNKQLYALCRNVQQQSFDEGSSWRIITMGEELVDLFNRGWLHDVAFDPNSKESGWMVGKWGIILRTVYGNNDNWERIH